VPERSRTPASTTSPPSQIETPARWTTSAKIPTGIMNPVPAWPERPGVSSSPIAPRAAASSAICSRGSPVRGAAGRPSMMTTGSMTSRSPSRAAETSPYLVLRISPMTDGSNAPDSGSPAA
jgi:hypothetical protein